MAKQNPANPQQTLVTPTIMTNWAMIKLAMENDLEEIRSGEMILAGENDGDLEKLFAAQTKIVKGGHQKVSEMNLDNPQTIIDAYDALIASENAANAKEASKSKVVVSKDNDYVLSADKKTVTGTDSRGEKVTLSVADRVFKAERILRNFTRLSFTQGSRKDETSGEYVPAAWNLHGISIEMDPETNIGFETPVHYILNDSIMLMESGGVLIETPFGAELKKTIKDNTDLSIEIEQRRANKTSYMKTLANGTQVPVFNYSDSDIPQELTIKKASSLYTALKKRYNAQLGSISTNAVEIEKERALSRIRVDETKAIASNVGAGAIGNVKNTLAALKEWKAEEKAAGNEDMVEAIQIKIDQALSQMTSTSHQIAAPQQPAAPALEAGSK